MRRTSIAAFLVPDEDSPLVPPYVCEGPDLDTRSSSNEQYHLPFIRSASSSSLSLITGVVLRGRDLDQSTVLAGYYNSDQHSSASSRPISFDAVCLCTSRPDGLYPALMVPQPSSLISAPYRPHPRRPYVRQHTFVDAGDHTYSVAVRHPRSAVQGSLEDLVSLRPLGGPRPAEFAYDRCMNTVIPLHYRSQIRVTRLFSTRAGSAPANSDLQSVGVILESRVPRRNQQGYNGDERMEDDSSRSPTCQLDRQHLPLPPLPPPPPPSRG